MLAIARGIAEIYGRSLPIKELGLLVGRGGTSGIGTAAFEHGGFIIDGGHTFGQGCEKSEFRPSAASRGVRPPPVIVHHEFPADWRILLAMPNLPAGASGMRETDIFKTHCPVRLDEVQALCHEILMRMLPGIIEKDLELFGSSVNVIQGLGFKKVELGLQPKEIPALIELMRSSGAACAGMSSFGPTVYAIDDTDMRGIEQAAQSFMNDHGGRINPDHFCPEQRGISQDCLIFLRERCKNPHEMPQKKLHHLLHPNHIEWLAEFTSCILQPAHFSKTTTQMKLDTRFIF